MKRILKESIKDCSTKTQFCFHVCCMECGSVWKSRPVAFSKAETQAPTMEKQIVYDVLYQREKERALEQALNEAREVFSVCPICGRLVCDQCFLICEELDMCSICAKCLKEPGYPVTDKEKQKK